MPGKLSLIGQIFGPLTVESRAPNSRHGKTRWYCRCAVCGGVKAIVGSTIKRGESLSCGCRRAEFARKRFTKHGLSCAPIRNIHSKMLKRCFNPADPAFHNYGGRGITVCARWLSLENFAKDMGPRPTPEHSVDRINNDGDYEPGNCRWATRAQQSKNSRRPRLIEIDGQTKNISEWARLTGLSARTISLRLKCWPLSEVLSPKKTRWSRKPRLTGE
jgi:hypothetical protein